MFKWRDLLFLSLLFLCLIQLTSAQHDHATMGMDEPVPAFNATGDELMSYALFPEKKGYFYIHVAMMVIAFWVLMPIGIMLGIAKSSFHVPVQLLAFCFAMAGFFFAQLYGHSTPHLYKGNSHHTLGWILFLFMLIQMSVGVVRKIANAVGRRSSNAYERLQEVQQREFIRSGTSSSSSDHQSEASGDTLHMNEFDLDKQEYRRSSNPEINNANHSTDYEDDPEGAEENDQLVSSLNDNRSKVVFEKEPVTMRLFNLASPYIPSIVKDGFVMLAYNPFTKVVCRYFHMIMGRTFIVLIFVQTLSGLVVYHGVCRSWEVLGCIAHLIKGGIFFFYGMGTFGRYLGAFANRGWAWNKVEGASGFSFEMVECSLIFVYGITNTWMEHFGQDSAWTHKDLEHASLAFMWWWCGLVGILVESRAVRRLLERTILTNTNNTTVDREGYSWNPFPALTVLMTGISMGNHHQDTAYSSNIHYMWGLLLATAALCRFITYITLYRNPPKDSQPTRPPSELVGAFLLTAGSILFMASNSGTLLWLRRNNVDSMFLMNVCVAFTSITLTYVATLMVIKAWSEKREWNKRQARQSTIESF
ncbi:hypothetical protein BDF20DRAFT_860992 [Mycotypha africana]|uniref:uncharacterized protein n=1 Tax=Mycotypha africana TaxID=64632 RepID=UPI0022FFF88F|nr:uncharacterized protein BDF20DRAFT_860992 [Mycotypha africana]KAI8984637.1 hypothetical protein BDF20DRAFT_860992 [Mycotypha africana]